MRSTEQVARAPEPAPGAYTPPRVLSAAGIASLVVFAATPAEGGRSTACSSDYSYAGVQGNLPAVGVAARLAAVKRPAVSAGHTAGWVGVGGPGLGANGAAEWLQAGIATFKGDGAARPYYEVAVPGSDPRFVHIGGDLRVHETHRFAVAEVVGRAAWWRVWMDGRAVSPAIHLPGSHRRWFPQAVGESWNNGSGACNDFAFRFANVVVAPASRRWQPLERSFVFQDAGYRVVQTSRNPRSFVAAGR